MAFLKIGSCAFAAIVIFSQSVANSSGHVVIQDVVQVPEYSEDSGENYFGTYVVNVVKSPKNAGVKTSPNSETCRFVQSPCGSGTIKDGVCVPRGQCNVEGGTVSDANCQDGIGECCVFTEMCNENRTTIEVNQMVTTLNSPTTVPTECTFRFHKEPNICQIRLDFVNYKSDRADMDGNCVTEKLKISNTITVDPTFTTCGVLTDQHMYLTFGSQDRIDIQPVISMDASEYKILATKIPCDSENRAPDYCLQYFTKTEDTVKSFDFGGQQQNNQMYTICVKPTTSSTGIQWKPCTSAVGNPFRIIGPTIMPVTSCTTDWIQIKGLDKTCEYFSSLMSMWKPYEVMVNFDAMEFPPPPPPGFTIPLPPDTDPAQCETACMDLSMPPSYTCGCVDQASLLCSCVIGGSGFPTLPQIDLNNTGFCLEYEQI